MQPSGSISPDAACRVLEARQPVPISSRLCPLQFMLVQSLLTQNSQKLWGSPTCMTDPGHWAQRRSRDLPGDTSPSLEDGATLSHIAHLCSKGLSSHALGLVSSTPAPHSDIPVELSLATWTGVESPRLSRVVPSCSAVRPEPVSLLSPFTEAEETGPRRRHRGESPLTLLFATSRLLPKSSHVSTVW